MHTSPIKETIVFTRRTKQMAYLLWPPYGIWQAIIFLTCDLYILYGCPMLYLSFFSSPNLSGRRLDVYHTSTHGVPGVALVRI